MARPSKLWFRKDRNAWFATIDGVRHNLGKDKTAAEKQFHKLKASDQPILASTLAIEVFDKFLDWTQMNKAPRT